MNRIRIFAVVNQLSKNKIIEISGDDFDYLVKVMRQKIGDEIFIFNGCDGEWRAEIILIAKKVLQIRLIDQNKKQYFVPKMTLAFAPVKNVRIDFIAAKATELGVANFQPIITQNTIIDKINSKRFLANIKEAAEQCGRTDLASLQNILKLEKFINDLKDKKQKYKIILCDESGQASKAEKVLSKIDHDKNKDEIIILIGPEGGFSKEEFVKLKSLDNLSSISLGPRILRADTAMIAALTLVQEFLGDFI